MTRLSLKALTLIALVFGISSQAAKADVDLTDGIRAFICEGEAVVLFEADAGWLAPTDPTAEVKRIGNGWRYEDTLNGEVWYLREESRNSWVMEGLSEDGFFTADCIDVAGSVSEVVTIIKPRLDAAIASIQNDLVETKEALTSSEQENVQLSQYNNQLTEETNDLRDQLAESADLEELRSQAESVALVLATPVSELAAAVANSQQDRTARLAEALVALSTEKALSAEGQRQVAALNAQVAELRKQVGTLQTLLNLADEADTDTQVQIQSLGTQLNTALARVAAEERRRLALETAACQLLE